MSPEHRQSAAPVWFCAILALLLAALPSAAHAEDEAEQLIAASRQARAAKKPAESERLARQALEIADQDPENNQASKQGEAWNLIGLAHLESGDPAGSVEPLKKALAAFDREPERHEERILVVLFNLTLVHLEMKDFPAAATATKRRIATLEKTAPDSNVLIEDWLRLSRAFAEQQDFATARDAVTKGREIAARRDGPKSAIVANLNDRLADLWEQEKEYAEAETLYRESLEIRRELFADSAHEDVFNSLYRLGDNRRLAGDFKQALELFTQTDEKIARRNGPDSATRVDIVKLRRDAAKELGEAAIEADCQKLLDRLTKVGEWERTLPEIKDDLTPEQLAEADGKLTAALAAAREFGDESMPVFYAHFLRALWHQYKLEHEAAISEYDEALRLGRGIFGNDHPEVAKTHMRRAVSLQLLGRSAEAQVGYETAAAANIASGFADFQMQTVLAGRLTDLGLATNNAELAVLWFARERKLRADLRQPPDQFYGKRFNEVGVVHARQEDWTTAEEYFAAALAVLEPRLPPEAPLLATVRKNLAFAREQLAAAAAVVPRPSELPLVSDPLMSDPLNIERALPPPEFPDLPLKIPPLAALPPREPPQVPNDLAAEVFKFGVNVIIAMVIGAILGYHAWRRGYFPLTWLAAFVASCTTPIITACLLAALPDRRIHERRARERRRLAAQLREAAPLPTAAPASAVTTAGSLGDAETRG
ncbi:MAG: tetratricopeptide repeat protein [Pirellulaceae bacterium]|nr:tetratricopeptide repeat protein [Pirellulaceae bacterium]